LPLREYKGLLGAQTLQCPHLGELINNFIINIASHEAKDLQKKKRFYALFV
jgi:hypothetical protein